MKNGVEVESGLSRLRAQGSAASAVLSEEREPHKQGENADADDNKKGGKRGHP
jgi:hypothetical protein